MSVFFSSSVICFASSKKPVTMEILTAAKTVDYCVNDTLDTKGLSILVTYDDGSKTVLTEGYQTLYDFSNTGKNDVVISYTENDVKVETCYSVNVIENPVLAMTPKEVYAGTVFELPVEISQNCGLMGIDIRITYDAEVFTPLSVEKGALITDGLIDDSITTSEKGSFDIIWSGSKEIIIDGNICTIKFLCNEDTKVDSSDIQISNVRENTYRENYNTIQCKESICNLKVLSSQNENNKKVLSDLMLVMSGWRVGEASKQPILSGNTGNGAVSYTYAKLGSNIYSTDKPSEAGTYVVKATVAETDEYYGGVATCIFTILKENNKKVLSDLVLTMPGWQVGEASKQPVLSGNTGNGAVSYTYAKLGSNMYSTDKPNEAGTYIVKATIAETDEYYSGVATCVFTITNSTNLKKQVSKISGVKSVYTKSVNSKAFSLKAKTNGDGKFQYKSSNKKVVTVNSKGKITVKGIGIAKVTISVKETQKYKAVSKQITITVRPEKMKIVSRSSGAKGTAKIKWKKDSNVDGYEILLATDKKFSKNKNKYTIKSKNKVTKKITNLKSSKKYYIKVRSYKIINKKKIYSTYSSAKNLVIK